MRRIFVASVALLGMMTVAEAQNYHHRHNPPHRHHYNHRPKQHNVMPWVAGGLALGLLGVMTYDAWGRPVRPHCWDEMIGYDRYGRQVWQRYCQ
jgi:hypothetical protein